MNNKSVRKMFYPLAVLGYIPLPLPLFPPLLSTLLPSFLFP